MTSAFIIVAAILAAPPPATFEIVVDGEPQTILVEGDEYRTGEVAYVAGATVGCVYVSVSAVYFESYFGTAVALLSNFYAANGCGEDASVQASFDVPICRVTGTEIGGLSTVTLMSRSDNASLACIDGQDWMTRTTSDGAGTQEVWQCPTELILFQPGFAYASTVWGSPIPSWPGPAEVTSLGVDAGFVLSGGDEAKIVVTSAVDGIFEAPPCPSDIDGDGIVGRADLGLLLAAWGGAGGDVNGDGTTDGADLGILLNDQGPCGC